MHNYLEALDEIVSFRPLDISGNLVALIKAEKTHHRGKHQLLFDWFGFDQTSQAVAYST